MSEDAAGDIDLEFMTGSSAASESVSEASPDEVQAETAPGQEVAIATPKAEKKGKAKGKNSGEILPPDPISQAAHKIENLNPDEARKLASELLDGSEFSAFQLGGVFTRINSAKMFLEYGHSTFKDYVLQEHGIGYRKAMYLIEIYNGVIEHGLTWDKVQHIGWTKLKTLLNPHLNTVNQENILEWVKKAENMTVLQLEQAVKGPTSGAQNALENDQGKEVTTMTFKLHPNQKDVVRTALEKAKEIAGTEVDTVALEMIATEFLGTPVSKKEAIAPVSIAIGSSEPEELADAFKGIGALEVLKAFEQAFPDVDLQVANLPE